MSEAAPLYPFQEETIARVVKTERAIFLAIEMGLGKTRIAIESALRLGAKRVLVIAPKIALTSWPIEVRRWAVGANMVLLRPGQAAPPPSAFTTFVAINYEALSAKPAWFLAWVRKWQPDMIVLDEAHFLKSHESKRTRLIYGQRCDGVNSVIEGVKKIVLLSGTPAPNFTSELWPHLRATYPQAIPDADHIRPMNFWQFRARYSVTEHSTYGERVIGSRNTPDLRRACAGYFVRIKAAEVLKDLPPIVWSTEPVTGDPPPLPPALQGAAGLQGEELLRWLRDNDIALATVRRLFGLAKVAGTVAWIEYFLENNPSRSLVVFAHHRDVLLALAGHLQAHQPIVVHGGTPLNQRVEAVETFQARKRRLWLGQMQASGTAITLTASSDVVFAEQDWTPSTMAQAAARTHRIGQSRPVMSRVLYLDESLDDAISQILVKKAREIALMFDNRKEAAE